MNKTTENRLGGELRSQQAARRLLEELRRGRYADAAQLPSELELADVLGVSRTVVRDALSDLERDGYVERVRGIGTLVNRDVVRVENRMDQKLEFNRMIRSIGRVPHSDNLMVTRETAMPELAAKLGLDPECALALICNVKHFQTCFFHSFHNRFFFIIDNTACNIDSALFYLIHDNRSQRYKNVR